MPPAPSLLMMRYRSPNSVPGTNRPSSEEESDDGGRIAATSVAINEAGVVADSEAAQAPQNRLVSGFSVAQRLHFICRH
jgi:hypothetical protein